MVQDQTPQPSLEQEELRGIARTVAEIEALMKTDGILQILKKNGGS